MGREINTIAQGFSFLESPRWHEGRIWFSDFYTGRVLSAEEDGTGQRVEAELADQPSGLGWLPDGRLLIAAMRDAVVLRREPGGELVPHAARGAAGKGHLNDMVADAKGRLYAGSFGFDLMNGAPIAPTSLVRMDPDGSVTVVAEDMLFPNGSVITEDGMLLVGETLGNRVTAFDIAEDGSLHDRRVWAAFGEPPAGSTLEEVLPQGRVAADGCCLDAEGTLWIADALNARVVRVREGGEILDEIHPGTGVFACMLGGVDGKTLFLCAAPDFAEANRRAARESALLSVRVEVPRAGRP
ncbi:SMP-30/gluconolactonase/LRE family protein [Sciscionella marina]|uniref:SMP-30/gluconolactonase/LRE family protein n=1 Tax=Sciscionella marina TaxID=508770 RepID=UPI000363994F|nr:SMP-30/gluconolactonase/LRE family protein [Sciscionella marina]